mmetsp:Transcript_3411/g.11518  ORF Transcript_3411/g.11518 Transcript_3411/m.11518 type:complete len:301 (-) Transcript_3411:2457-3359(-)
MAAARRRRRRRRRRPSASRRRRRGRLRRRILRRRRRILRRRRLPRRRARGHRTASREERRESVVDVARVVRRPEVGAPARPAPGGAIAAAVRHVGAVRADDRRLALHLPQHVAEHDGRLRAAIDRRRERRRRDPDGPERHALPQRAGASRDLREEAQPVLRRRRAGVFHRVRGREAADVQAQLRGHEGLRGRASRAKDALQGRVRDRQPEGRRVLQPVRLRREERREHRRRGLGRGAVRAVGGRETAQDGPDDAADDGDGGGRRARRGARGAADGGALPRDGRGRRVEEATDRVLDRIAG